MRDVDIDRISPKAFSVIIAFAAWRYCIGGKDKRFTIRECIKWLELIEAQDQTTSTR